MNSVFEAVPHLNGKDYVIVKNGVTYLIVVKCGSNDTKKEAEHVIDALIHR